jgi:hypothetical protein
MAKRDTGVGSKTQSKKSPYKTKKRLTIKYARLEALAKKRGK